MQLTTDLLTNLLHPPILAFILGMLAVACKSDLEVPPQIAKFLGLYLLFHIGIKGGEELFHSGFTFESIRIIGVCTLVSFITPWLFNKILKLRLNIYDAGAIAASYGSISAINFIASSSILDASNIPYSGYMVACMAFMESPAVIAGLIIIGLAKHSTDSTQDKPKLKMKNVLHEALFNGSVFLLIGSMLIGFLSGHNGEVELKSFVDDIFKGMLSFYMLDMGILAAHKIKGIKGNILFLGSFALFYPIISAVFAILLAKIIGLNIGNAFLFTTLVSSCSFIAVPSSLRLTTPEANMGILLAMSLGITFVFNIIFGPSIYLPVIQYLWGL